MAFLCLLPVTVTSQDWIRIRFANGDSLYEKSVTRRVSYSEDSLFIHTGRGKASYHAKEVSRVEYGTIHLVSEKAWYVDEFRQVFLEPVISGFVSLYQGCDRGGKKIFYLQKGDDMIHYVPETYFQGYINLFFSDCESLGITMNQTSMERYEYSLSHWFELTARYNRCRNPDGGMVFFREPPVRSNYTVSAGLALSRVRMNSWPYSNHNFRASLSPYAGITATIEYYNYAGICLGLFYCYTGGKTRFVSPGKRFDQFNNPIIVDVQVDLDYDIHLLEIPLLARLNLFPGRELNPYLEAGPVIETFILNRSDVIADDDYTPGVEYSYRINLERFAIGFRMGGGLDFSAGGRNMSMHFDYSRHRYNVDPITSYSYTGERYAQSSADKFAMFSRYILSLRIGI